MDKKEILSVVRAMKLYPVLGALGDMKGCAAYVESERVTENGQETKYFGIKTPFKGKIDNDIIDRVTITKRAFTVIIQLFPLRIGKIIDAFHQIYRVEGGLKSRCLRLNEFCPVCRELIRTGIKIINNERIKDLIYCFAMFLQFSSTYRVYLQDIVGELDKVKFFLSPIKEVWRLKKLALERKICIKGKLNFVVWVIILALVFKRKKVFQFISELNLNKIRLDEQDWYFCLRRSSYDFRGMSLSERLKEVERIDKEQGNVILGI